MALPRLIGMVHLGPLPGSPRYAGDIDGVITRAVADAEALAAAGFDAVLIENYGDAPFFADAVPPVTVAAVARAATAVRSAVSLPIGINILRNDAPAAVSVAAATGAAFIRVNVLTGMMQTDQGPIVGRAAEVARLVATLAPGLDVLADVLVKHAVPPPGLTLEAAAADTATRGGAAALIVTGSATGAPAGGDAVARVKNAAPGIPVLVGSGVDAAAVAAVLERADGVIVGTGIKKGRITTAPVDLEAAAALVRAAQPAG